MKRVLTLVAVIVAAFAAYAVSASAGAAHHARAAAAATVHTRHTKLGTFLVDAKGRTLYLFEKDKTRSSTCYGECATDWPPLTISGKPKAGSGVKQSKLGVWARKNGAKQVTYAGHPLYRFSGDAKAGSTAGEGLFEFGAKWYVIAPSGKKIDND